MANDNIITGQYVRIAQMPAKTSERVAAYLIDVLILSAYFFLMGIAIDDIHRSGHDEEAFIVLSVLPALLYPVLLETLNGGQTIGKWLMRTRVVKQDGSSPGVGDFLIRWLLLPIDIGLCGTVAAFSMLVTANRQRLGDLAAGTMVVKLNTYDKIKVSLDEFAFVQEGYQPLYPEATSLSAEEAERIAYTLADRSTSRRHRQQLLADQLSQSLGVSTYAKDADQFLARLLSDYRYYDLNSL